ncbi:hypothetical protein [Paenibacillus pini]|uniref:Uncharacterized protein n=1 Tax=Paenibacillus pini JCM 16418 TaxID=1236976 RepID=W7YPH3_9BACL|nr:hypothetical protein [Paenibacillus pini]GAF10347.1 hypothetical protein JCM16418_4529 [Paenibacillus pini JCM 16418]
MIKNTKYYKKALFIALSFLLIGSVLFNVYQYKTIHNERNNYDNLSQIYMSNHELTFSNVFALMGDSEAMVYIKTPEHVSKIIEGIYESNFYYLASSNFITSNKVQNKSISTVNTRNLIENGYLDKLKSYRTYLSDKQDIPYEDINEISLVMKDLQTISSWLKKKYDHHDYQFYNDQDFYQEVYKELQSNIKQYYFNGFSK